MKTRILVTALLGAATFNAQATLQSWNTLSIQNDAVTSYNASSSSYYVSGDGPLLDSFFTLGYKTTAKLALNTQYSYIYGVSPITLNGAVNPTVGTWNFYNIAGSNDSGGLSGLSILSASGDSASINMSNWMVQWNGTTYSMGSGAWTSAGYSNGVGNLTCTAGSGCAVGSAYILKYTATVPPADQSCFCSNPYYLELHGTVGAVPEPEAYGMMLAGLGLVGAMTRRRRATRA